MKNDLDYYLIEYSNTFGCNFPLLVSNLSDDETIAIIKKSIENNQPYEISDTDIDVDY